LLKKFLSKNKFGDGGEGMSDAPIHGDADEETRQGVRWQFMWSIQALACSPDDQRSLFPDFVCKADELALDYDQSFGLARSWFGAEFTSEQLAALQAIDSRLDAMSRGGTEFDDTLWHEDALSCRSEWEDVRSLAKAALACFRWQQQKPPPGRSLYANGSHEPE
jgi:hypothetical protein